MNVASVAGLEASCYPAAPYPASKGASILLTKDLANEWARFPDGPRPRRRPGLTAVM
ncbi:MAG: hypothetical protein M3322_12330 [Actinomycetota bacterium]|nr:hypothetical protein [Actinomycetota bacterium]